MNLTDDFDNEFLTEEPPPEDGRRKTIVIAAAALLIVCCCTFLVASWFLGDYVMEYMSF